MLLWAYGRDTGTANWNTGETSALRLNLQSNQVYFLRVIMTNREVAFVTVTQGFDLMTDTANWLAGTALCFDAFRW